MKETKITVLSQGDVELAHNYGYMVVGDGNAVCFYVDVDERTVITGSSNSDNGCPKVYLDRPYDVESEVSTEIEFSEFPGWRVHATRGGKSIAIALVKEEDRERP